MSKKLYLIFSPLIFVVIFIVFFIGINPRDSKACDCSIWVFSEESMMLECVDPEPCLPPPPPPPCVPTEEVCSDSSGLYRCNDFAVYKCGNNSCGKSGGAIEQGTKWYGCVDVSCDDGCNTRGWTEVRGGPFGPDQIGLYGTVPDYQICPASNNDWGPTPPTPVCSGSCYPSPDLKPLNDSSLSPKNIFDGSKLKLPINFGWDDNVAQEVAKDPNLCAVGSYEFNIVNPPISKIVADTQLQKTDDSAYKLECQLKSNTDYQWRVRACLDAGGTDCGSWSSGQNFGTSLTPELVSPYDPDWEGTTIAKNITPPVTLDWCDVKDAGSYRFQVYIIEGGKKICHPSLLSTKGGKQFCDSWLLRKTRRDPDQIDKILYSDFIDENMEFFTKDANYTWQTSVCDDDGFNCGSYGQLWALNTKEVPLSSSLLVSPTNDPNGKKPVGLPLILDWNDQPGVNSFIYEVVPATGGQKISGNNNASQSKSLDFPQLSLNTLYKWRVKSCSDFESKKCEPDFSEEWYFKTTGQSPNLISPSSDEQNVVIPVNFTWENVPGAKSYVFKISGGSLSLEKTLDKPEFSVDFPEYAISQETDYSWQVKTCAWSEGKTCGLYSDLENFKTFRLPPPQNPYPTNNGRLFTGDKYVSWGKVSGAKAYQYQIKLISLAEKETDETCPALVGKDLFEQPKTALANSNLVELKCLGQYQWQARSCLDTSCRETSNWSGPWSFNFLEGGTGGGGLVPCGRSTNNDKTPWNEREPCQLKHIFLSVKIIIDFLLLRMIPIILVLLSIATAVIFYTSLGQAITMTQVIALWKAAGKGLLIIFFAWTIVNIFLKFVGFNIGVFGNWYQLPM